MSILNWYALSPMQLRQWLGFGTELGWQSWFGGQTKWRKVGLIGSIGYFIVRASVTFIKKRNCRKKIEAKRTTTRTRREILKQKLEEDGVLVTEERALILKLDILELSEQLRFGRLLPTTVLEAYQAKALHVNEDINAVVDFILEANELAKNLENLDEERRGPLYGIPVSIKEVFFVGGYDATNGLASLTNQPAIADCPIVKRIKELHGVPFCLTNVPQTCVSYSCSNPVYGNTANPHDLSRTPGGSSGGEAALIAAGGSILGLGSDIAGSLRIPSHFSGICGLKPTNGRIYEGGKRGGAGTGVTQLRIGVYSTSGFMSPSVPGLVLGMKALLDNPDRMADDDWRVAPLPWRDQLFSPSRKMKIGWYDQDGVFPATPGCSRAVREVAELLREDGHEVVEYLPADLEHIMATFRDILIADKGYHSLQAWDGEILDQAIEMNALSYKTPPFLRRFISPLFWLFSQHMLAIWNSGKDLSRDLWVTNADKDRLTYAFTAAWEKHGFDVLVCPGFAFPACPPKYCTRILPAASYTSVYNLLGNPSGVLPVTKENKTDQLGLDQYPVKDDMCHRLAAEATRGGEGLPIGVQVVGRHWQEETVLHAMAVIEKLLKLKTDRT